MKSGIYNQTAKSTMVMPIGNFFTFTGWLVLLMAAGLAANAAGYLNKAGLVPAISMQVWDSGWLLHQDSGPGTLLHILIGYNDRPLGIQVVFYAVTLVGIYLIMWLSGSARLRSNRQHTARGLLDTKPCATRNLTGGLGQLRYRKQSHLGHWPKFLLVLSIHFSATFPIEIEQPNPDSSFDLYQICLT